MFDWVCYKRHRDRREDAGRRIQKTRTHCSKVQSTKVSGKHWIAKKAHLLYYSEHLQSSVQSFPGCYHPLARVAFFQVSDSTANTADDVATLIDRVNLALQANFAILFVFQFLNPLLQRVAF